MTINNIVNRMLKTAVNSTIDYQPSSAWLQKNGKRSILGFAAVGVLSFLPGPGYISTALAIYSATKGYQALRDYKSNIYNGQ